MATDDRSAEDREGDPRRCEACRGTGRVVSNLGGTPQEVTCPWCEGTGHWLPEHDAQARFRSEGGPGAGPTV